MLSFLINISVVHYLEKNTTSVIDSETILKIQEQYARLLLNDSQRTVIPPRGLTSTESDLPGEGISGLTEWLDGFSLNIFESLNELPDYEGASTPSETGGETLGYSKEELNDMRRSTAEKRLSARSNLEREVESVGLLGLISSERKSNEHDYVQDLMEYASKKSDHLVSTLSKLNSIEIPRYGNNVYQGKVKGISSNEKFADLKGDRKSVDGEVDYFVDNMEPLNKVKTEDISRNVLYEEVESSYPNGVSDPSLKRKRTSSEVISVVRSHMTALQDCYKQELKNNPDLKGRVVVRFVITPEGIVSEASLVSSSLNNSWMENCLLSRIERWKDFPPCDPSYGNMTYRQKFAFGM